MIAKLIVEGKEFPIEIQDPELEKLLVPQKKTGYERVDGEGYFFCEYGGRAVRCKKYDDNDEKIHYTSANYYSDETVAANNARADKLMRQLRRFAVEHREKELDWSKETYKHYIRYVSGKPDVWHEVRGRDFGCIYFDTAEVAELAIETFKDELMWYFTEYKDSL